MPRGAAKQLTSGFNLTDDAKEKIDGAVDCYMKQFLGSTQAETDKRLVRAADRRLQ